MWQGSLTEGKSDTSRTVQEGLEALASDASPKEQILLRLDMGSAPTPLKESILNHAETLGMRRTEPQRPNRPDGP